ncbi:fluoride efflux transporter CrcB [Salinarimonas ramus]|uniref:Fluoride-specific ion channel FluC n=1 Tax=Salinarimonas ramus TaxID=690164 RepID=A0A917Q4D5_9HYPH|nr:fluoride efflux transporter CrcB [Salinarimonas ramus]GGK22236.1 putative fluoride ion transporter CrcB [Salinarimonas ramus]
MSALTIFVGAGLGGVLRWLVGLAALRAFGPGFPWGTLAVNVAGSLAMGLVASLVVARMPSETLRLFLMTGLLGGFTTFSAFSLDAAALVERGQLGPAAFYVLASVGLSLAAIALGLVLGRAIAG